MAESCPLQAPALFTAAARLFGLMDDLTAAAAVLAMDIDSECEDDVEQDVEAGAPVGKPPPRSASEPSPAEKENERNLPERRSMRAAKEDAATDAQKVRRTPRTASDTSHSHLTTLLRFTGRSSCTAAEVDRALSESASNESCWYRVLTSSLHWQAACGDRQ